MLDDVTGRIALLAARPSTLDEFVAYMVMHTQQLDDRKLITSQASQVDDMFESLAAHEQKVPAADQVKHDDLNEALTEFQGQLTEVCLSVTADVNAQDISHNYEPLHALLAADRGRSLLQTTRNCRLQSYRPT